MKTLKERFMGAFNTVDAELRRHTNALAILPRPSFPEVLSEYVRLFGRAEDASFLHSVNSLRNIFAHADGKSPVKDSFAEPAEAVVLHLEEIATRLVRDEKAGDGHRRTVKCMQISDTIGRVLGEVRLCGFSQFPVYGPTGFVGLLTENGLSRWLATAVSERGLSLQGVTVDELLKAQEAGMNVEFFPIGDYLDLARMRFRENRLLEALLLTPSGTAAERPVGIITRHDLA